MAATSSKSASRGGYEGRSQEGRHRKGLPCRRCRISRWWRRWCRTIRLGTGWTREAAQGLGRTTITRYDSRCLVQPPSQHTSHSPKREPIVTGVRRRRNLVSSCMDLSRLGPHIHPSPRVHSQVLEGMGDRSSIWNRLSDAMRTIPLLITVRMHRGEPAILDELSLPVS